MRTAGARTSNAPGGRVFWALAAAGWAVALVGLWGLFKDARSTMPPDFARWFLGSAVVHDLLVAPAVFAGAVLVRRVVPKPWLRYVQAGLIVSGIMLLVGLPLLLGLGRNPDNPTIQPGNYAAGVTVILTAVWAAVGVLGARAARPGRPRQSSRAVGRGRSKPRPGGR